MRRKWSKYHYRSGSGPHDENGGGDDGDEASGSGGKFEEKKGRKMNQTSNYEANSRQRYMCSLGYPKKTLLLNFAMVKKSRHCFCDEDIDRCGFNWSKGTKMCNFDSKIWIFGAKCQFFYLESRFLSTGHITKKKG